MSCQCLSFRTFCKNCEINLLSPSISKRTIGTLDVYSFYKYSTIENLLLSKHTPQGYRIFKALADITLKPFMLQFISADPREISIIGVDEKVKNGYSHVALLTHAMKTKNANIMHSSLLASNDIKYSGQSLQYRLEHPRNFIYKGKKDIDAILVDDIITTGGTLQQAQSTLLKSEVQILFALTLADAKE
ncbi:MAG: ComF family protein [Sulfurovaceae bacterium]|nr:ComF family protein [Sulfurovaceae bacterium]